MIGHVEHLRTNLEVQRVMELERTANTGVPLQSAEASNQVAWCVSLGIPLRHAKGWIGRVGAAVEDAAPGKSGTVQIQRLLRSEVHTARVGVAGNRVEEEVTAKVDRKTCSGQHPAIDSPTSQ